MSNWIPHCVQPAMLGKFKPVKFKSPSVGKGPKYGGKFIKNVVKGNLKPKKLKHGAGCDAKRVLRSKRLDFKFYGDTQAFLAVNTSILHKVLKTGYKVFTRFSVPCASTPIRCV